MKILFVLGRYLPHKNGGIENYSHLLSIHLLNNNHKIEIAILESPETNSYIFENVKINLLNSKFENFKKLLQEEKYDICHFQEYSAFGGIELFWFFEAKKYCEKIFFTFHLPYFTCYKNDFRYKGITDCNTFSNPQRCVECIVATKLKYKKNTSLPMWNWVIDAITPFVKRSKEIELLRGRINERTKNLSQLLGICAHVFIYADWFLKILKDNGYDARSLTKIPYVTNSNTKAKNGLVILPKKRILFVGRIEPQKGLHLLCKAMNLISTENIQLDVFGNVVDEKYYRDCLNVYDFNFKGTLPLNELLSILGDYDFLIMPSVFTEMYSMMIKDAFNFQLPVIASTAKGNVNAIHDGENGFLFNYDDHQALSRVIDKGYQMLENGWLPQFDLFQDHEKDLNEILSYYN